MGWKGSQRRFAFLRHPGATHHAEVPGSPLQRQFEAMNAELLRVTFRVIGEVEITCHHLATLSTPRIAPLLSAFTENLAGRRLVQTDNGLPYKERCRPPISGDGDLNQGRDGLPSFYLPRPLDGIPSGSE